MKTIHKIFLHPKPVKLLLSLRSGPKYATLLSKEIDCTYSHTTKLLENFQKFGLVEFEKRGRIKIIKLTKSGEELSEAVDALMAKLSKI